MTKRNRRSQWQKIRNAVCRLMGLHIELQSKVLYLEERIEALEKCIDEMCQDGNEGLSVDVVVPTGAKTGDFVRGWVPSKDDLHHGTLAGPDKWHFGSACSNLGD